MDDNRKNIININNLESYSNINQEEEILHLLNNKDNNEGLNNIEYKNDNNYQIKEFILKVNNEKTIKDENLKKRIEDYIITIQYTKLFRFPYFIFGNIINLYFPCHKFKSKKVNLSQMPTPPFTIIIKKCK